MKRYGDIVKKREVPTKNYIIFAVISIITIVAVLGIANWYKQSKEYYENHSIMNNILSEINANEIGSYIMDNPDFIIYIASSKDQTIKSFEKKLKKLVINNEIKNNILYLDSSKIENEVTYKDLANSFLSDELKKEKTNINISPNMLYVKNNKITNILYTNQKNINIEDVENFLISCEILVKND